MKKLLMLFFVFAMLAVLTEFAVAESGGIATNVPGGTCGFNPKVGMCAGQCKGNQICQQMPGSHPDNCGCIDPPPPACGQNPNTKLCVGSCKTGLTCQLNVGNLHQPCACLPSPVPCGFNQNTKQCGGSCPGAPGALICRPKNPKNPKECGCMPQS
jgi:hypothetical protein